MEDNDRGLDVILNDDDIYDEAFYKYLANYKKEYSHEFVRNVQNMPFSILITVNGELKDLNELKEQNHHSVYFLTLLDNDNDLISYLYSITPKGIEGFRYVLGFLFMYNITRLHKIVERNANGVVYSDTPNDIFKNIDSWRVVNTGAATPQEKELINIINDEAAMLYPDGSVRPDLHPFDGNSLNSHEYFSLITDKFQLFLNRVSLRYYKHLILNKK